MACLLLVQAFRDGETQDQNAQWQVNYLPSTYSGHLHEEPLRTGHEFHEEPWRTGEEVHEESWRTGEEVHKEPWRTGQEVLHHSAARDRVLES